MIDIQTRKDNAEVAIAALDEAHCDSGQLSNEELVGDFRADLMHLEGFKWVMDRVHMAESHFEDERDEAEEEDEE